MQVRSSNDAEHQFTSYMQRLDSDIGAGSPTTPQVIVLPPRSRFEPTGASVTRTALEEPIFEDDTIETTEAGRGREPTRGVGAGGRSRTMSPPAAPRQAFGSGGDYKASGRGGNRSGRGAVAIPGSGGMRPRSGRPATGAAYYQSASKVSTRPIIRRPTSAPVDDNGMPTPTGRPNVYALWTPGEAVLSGPTFTPPSSAGPGERRRPATEELQYELSVTANVLRAAQDRLAKEREQRQLARVGEELALVDVKRAREEAKVLSEQRRDESKAVAQQMAEQRKELEAELRKLESDQQEAVSSMQAEIDTKERSLRQAEARVTSYQEKIEELTNRLGESQARVEDLMKEKASVNQALPPAQLPPPLLLNGHATHDPSGAARTLAHLLLPLARARSQFTPCASALHFNARAGRIRSLYQGGA
jgi:hypothetical protein